MTTLALPFRFGFPSAANGSALLGIPEERPAQRQLNGSAEELVRSISALRRDLLSTVLEKRTAREFARAANEAFPRFCELVIHHGMIATSLVSKEAIARLAQESLCELEADIRERAAQAFGADLRDRAMFTVWTLRKIASLVDELSEQGVTLSDQAQTQDNDYLTSFLLHALRARFSLDLLMQALRSGKTVYPDVQPYIADGLRSTVNAYAWVKQAADLRRQPADGPLAALAWDEEDEELLAESMVDAASEEQDEQGDEW